jgi:hypothetical protein
MDDTFRQRTRRDDRAGLRRGARSRALAGFHQLSREAFRDGSTILWHANRVTASHHYEAKVLRALEERYAAINPWMPKKMLMPSGALHRTEELYPEDELVKTEFYADLMAPNDLFKGFGISLFNDRRFTFLSIIRSKKAGAPAPEELHLLAQLTPHLQRALQVHERLQLLPR